MDLHGFVKRLDVPSAFVAPSEPAFADLRAGTGSKGTNGHAITYDGA
jgi:hypothetical protein